MELSKEYDLGVTTSWLGSIAEERIGLPARAAEMTRRLMDVTRATSLLHVRHGDYLVTAKVSVPADTPAIHLPVGGRIPLHKGVGRVVLAEMDQADRARTSSRLGYAIDVPQLEQIRGRGYELSDGEVVEGVHAIGAAVKDSAGAPVAVVAVASLTSLEHQAQDVITTANAISKELGNAFHEESGGDDQS